MIVHRREHGDVGKTWQNTTTAKPHQPNPHYQRGMKGVVKNLQKLVLMKLVLVKTGNGEKKFSQDNDVKLFIWMMHRKNTRRKKLH